MSMLPSSIALHRQQQVLRSFSPLMSLRFKPIATFTHGNAGGVNVAVFGHCVGRIFKRNDDRMCYRRQFASGRRTTNSSNKKGFNLQALPFSISPEEALESFRKWAQDDQGLRYLMSFNSVKIGAAYVPVWSFNMNIRFKQQTSSKGRSSYSWKPSIFEGYDRGGSQSRQDVIYLPGGLSAYAGYSYRRSLINAVHSTTLIFMGDDTEPFGNWMLKPMMLRETGFPIHVIPDAWCSTQVSDASRCSQDTKRGSLTHRLNDSFKRPRSIARYFLHSNTNVLFLFCTRETPSRLSKRSSRELWTKTGPTMIYRHPLYRLKWSRPGGSLCQHM